MQQDNRSLSQEHYLVEFARRLETTNDGRVAVHLHLSKLRAENRQPYQLRVANAFLKPLGDKYQGRIFPLGNGDTIMVLRDAKSDDIDNVLARLRYLFAEDPLTEGDSAGEAGLFESRYALDREYHSFRMATERLYETARKEAADAQNRPKTNGDARPLTADLLPRLLNGINSVDISALLRRQPICVIMPGNPPQPVMWEVMAELGEVGRLLSDGIDLDSNRWYRYALRDAVLERLMAWLTKDGISDTADPVSIDATVAGLLSEQFLSFDTNLSTTAKKRVVFELQEIDAFSNLGALMFARDLLQERGYRLCLDGLNHLTLPLIGRKRLGFDFLKLHWGPDFEHDVRADRTRELADTIADIGPARLILYRCASARAIDCGRSMGITLFQGSYVDSMMRGAGPKNGSGAA